MIPRIFPIIKNSSACTALLGTNPVRFFPFGEAPEKSAYPYATYFVPTGEPQNQLSSTPDMDRLTTQIDIWAKSGESALGVATALRDALEPHGHMISINDMGRDSRTESYRYRLDFDFFTTR
jgi:hypothetical protein